MIADFFKTIIQTMFRFFPFSTETGLRVIGHPGRDAPVFLTCNFELTVIRVMRALKGLDCYLLVAPSKGINVWCASGGGMLNAYSVTSVLKTSGIAEKVDHRVLILPQFSAPGIDVTRVAEQTGWRCRFGPAYARDIASYVEAGYQKTEVMRQARFPLTDRLEMAVMWATPLSVVVAIPMLLFGRSSLPGMLALIWGFSLFIFVFYESVMRFVPGPVGLVKTMVLGLLIAGGVAAYGLLVGNWAPASIVTWSVAILVVALILGFDLDGSSPLHAGSTVAFWGRRWPWVLRIWSKFGYELDEHFELAVNRSACAGCLTCIEVCPKAVFELYHLNGRQKAWIAHPEACEQCTACVKQCPEGAIIANPAIRTFVVGGAVVE
jgi:NAD-dependent dihydropyrimidine dehydrogenase PreA subunit